ncbi:MAG: glycosyltransferase family 4 protein [Pseudomonadota bacterium]
MTAKILVLSFERVPGIDAAGQHLTLLLPELAQRAEVDALSLKCDELGHIQRMGAARIMRVPSPSADPMEQIAAFERAVHRQLDAESYDLLWCSDLISAHTVAVHESSQRPPLVVDLFDLPSQTFCSRHGISDPAGQLARTLRRQEIIALRAAHRVLVHSQVLRQALLALNVAPDRIRMLPIAIDGALFSPPSIEVPTDPNACAVGVMLEPFELDLLQNLLDHWAHLPKRLHAVFIRDAPAGGEAAARIEKAGLGRRARLEYAGTPERLAEILTTLDVALCWSSVTEANETLGRIPMTTLCALYTGRPVLSVDSIAMRELLGDVNSNLRVAPGDLESIGPKLAELATSSALRKRLATRGREAASRFVHTARVVAQVQDIIEECLGRSLELRDPDETPVDSTPEMEHGKNPHRVPAEVLHTPVMQRPVPETPPTPRPVPSPVANPAPLAVGLSDTIDASAKAMDPWDHDTVATPMDMDEFGAVAHTAPDTRSAGADASLRSMALLDAVSHQEGGELQTEIRPRDDEDINPLGSGQETERLELSESVARRLERPLGIPSPITLNDEETLRFPSLPEGGPGHEVPHTRPMPLSLFEDAPVDPGLYSAGIVEEVTDRDQAEAEVTPAPQPRPHQPKKK